MIALPSLGALDRAAAARRVRRGRGRRNLAAFEDLPATQVVHDLSAEGRRCPGCNGERERIGEESSWQLEFIPARFERIEHVRVKYACRHCERAGENPRIERAAKPAAPIERGMAGPGLLAYVATSKFADYLPLYRLEAIFERHGFTIGRAAQGIWLADMAELARPVYERMKRRVMDSHLIATDDTIMPMLAPRKTRAARMWVYLGDEANPNNLFEFTLSRARDGPARFLAGYGQVLLADAYGGYNGVVAGNAITRAGCWAHARRKFVEAEAAAPAIARAAVALIAGLYRIEDRARALAAAERLALRQAESAPRLAELRDRLLDWKGATVAQAPHGRGHRLCAGPLGRAQCLCR